MHETVLPWQMPQWQRLTVSRDSDRMPHALLLAGPAGIGKRRFARALMQTLVCAAPTEEGACGQCRECHFGSQHPDLHTITVPEGKKQIGVDQIRELIELCSKTAFRSGGRKVVQVFPADAMNNHTANALLKTLEEPAGDTVLILISDAPARLPATIRSRCQQVVFPVPEHGLALQWLQVMISDRVACEACLLEAGGRPLAAQQLYETEGLDLRRRCDQSLADWSEQRQSLAQTVDALFEHELDFTLDWLAQRFHQLFRSAMTGDAENLPAPWRQWATRPIPAISAALDQVLELRVQFYRGVALNKRLVLEALLADWAGNAPAARAGLGL